MPSLPPGIATACADGLRLRVRLTPGAGGNEIAGTGIMGDGTACLKVRVTAIAEGGKANAAMIKLLAKSWRLPRSAFTIVAGQTDRNKTILIAGDADSLAAGIGGQSGQQTAKRAGQQTAERESKL